MSKTFRAWDVDQEWLLPVSVHDFVPAGHPAHLTRDVVRETLDLGEIMAAYDEPRGYAEQQGGRAGAARALVRATVEVAPALI